MVEENGTFKLVGCAVGRV